MQCWAGYLNHMLSSFMTNMWNILDNEIEKHRNGILKIGEILPALKCDLKTCFIFISLLI